MPLHHLSVLLQRTANLLVCAAAGRALLRFGAFVLLGALAAVALDGVAGLPETARVAVVALGAVGVLVGLAFAVRFVARFWSNPRATARRIEAALGWRDNRLINALDLEERPSASASPALVKKAVGSGESAASELSSTAAIDFRPLVRAAGLAAAVVVVVVACRVGLPGLFAAVVPRYLDPYGDHPPYTLVDFDISITPEPAVYGKPAEIVVKLGGPEAIARADVVFVEGAGRSRRVVQRLPMFRTGDSEFTLPMPQPEQSAVFFIDTPRGRSTTRTFAVAPVPSLEEAFVATRPPEYTGWKESRRPLDGAGIKGLKGTGLTVSARANLPLAHGLLELTPAGDDTKPTVVKLTRQADPRSVSAAFPLEFTGRYRLTIVGQDGTEGREPIEGKLTALDDRPPQVAIVHPDAEVIVVEGHRVPIVVQATDDVGLSKLELRGSINGFGPTPIDLDADLSEPTIVRGVAELDLGELGAKSGDVVTYFAIGWDRAPPDGQFTETKMHVLRVISEDEYLEHARSEYQMDDLLGEMEEFQQKLDELQKQRERLQDELETLRKKLKNDEELTKEDRAKLERAEQSLKRYAEATEKLAQQAKDRASQRSLYDVEESMLDMLNKLSEQLEKQSALAKEAADDLEQLRKDPDNEDLQQELEDALEALEEQNEGLSDADAEEREKLHQEMNRLRKVDELVQQGERLERLIKKQRDLADRLGEFRDKAKLPPEDQKRADRLAREQERLQQELQDTADKLEQSAAECEGECPKTAGDAKKLAQAIREQKIGEDQGSAAGSARKGNGRKAHGSAESAAQKLEALAGDAPGAEGAGGEMEGRSNDPGLELSNGKKGKSLRQMGRGRQLPQFRGMSGQRPGQQPGQQPGQEPGEGQDDGERGRQGSLARSKVLGPHQPMGDKMKPRMGQMGQDAPGLVKNLAGADVPGQTETLTPDGRAASRTAAGNLRGVPAPFRDQAEAYFRRLSEGK